MLQTSFVLREVGVHRSLGPSSVGAFGLRSLFLLAGMILGEGPFLSRLRINFLYTDQCAFGVVFCLVVSETLSKIDRTAPIDVDHLLTPNSILGCLDAIVIEFFLVFTSLACMCINTPDTVLATCGCLELQKFECMPIFLPSKLCPSLKLIHAGLFGFPEGPVPVGAC